MTFMDAMNIMNYTNTIKYLQMVKDLMVYSMDKFHPWTPSHHGFFPWDFHGFSIPHPRLLHEVEDR